MTQFKIGDRVKILEAPEGDMYYEYHHDFKCCSGTVQKTLDDLVYLKLTGGYLWFKAAYVELIEESKPLSAPQKKTTATGYCNCNGPTVPITGCCPASDVWYCCAICKLEKKGRF